MEYVLITGASGGIGYELSRIFCRNGYGLIMVSSDSGRLARARARLEQEFNMPITAYVQDLSYPGAAENLFARLKKDTITIDILVNNAGCGLAGPAETIDFKSEEAMMALNMVTPAELIKLFLPGMYERGRGKILNVSSIGCFQPGPFTAAYFASKAFLTSYSRAVRFEAKRKGVDICVLCPGATDTDFFVKEGAKTPRNAMNPEKTAAYAFRKLMKNREIIIPGLLNRIMVKFPVRLKMISVAGKKSGGMIRD